MKGKGSRTQRIVAGLVVLAGLSVLMIARRSAANAPAGHFTVNGDGTVTDNMTKLVWQRTVPSSTYTWADAGTYCASGTGLPGSGWRLPTYRELQTIVDDSQTNPSIDSTAFPSTPVGRYWTASPCLGVNDAAWAIYTYYGGPGIDAMSNMDYVRCVR
jgi:hypothetical protein